VSCGDLSDGSGPFHGRQSVCFYIAEDFDGALVSSTIDHSEFVVREYHPGEELVPLRRPGDRDWHPFHLVAWERVKDYPEISRYEDLFLTAVAEALWDDPTFEYRNRSGIKIGGWPTTIQFGDWYPGWCDIQIDTTQNYMYEDAGIAHLSRDGERWDAIFDRA
jgi:hypothetical protein